MRKNVFRLTLCAALFALCSFADAQQPKKVPRIGYLAVNSPSVERHLVEAFQQGLRGLGWAEGQNIVIEYRDAGGKLDGLSDLAAQLVGLNVDVIVVAGGTPSALAARQATRTIPIVMTNVGDPVGTGLVASLARPGGNITGLSRVGPDLAVTKLELLTEGLPKISRVAFIWNPANPASELAFRETEVAARTLRVQLQSVEVRGPKDFEAAFSAMTRARAGALIVQADPIFRGERARLADLAVKNQLPTMLPQSE